MDVNNMMNDKILTPEKLYISTIAEDDAELAQKYGLGLEIAEYCTAWNMDEFFDGKKFIDTLLGGYYTFRCNVLSIG